MTCPAGMGCKSLSVAPAASQPVPQRSREPKKPFAFSAPISEVCLLLPSHSALQAEGAPGQKSAWSEILAVSEQRHLCLYFKAEHFYFIHSRRQIVNIPEVFY